MRVLLLGLLVLVTGTSLRAAPATAPAATRPQDMLPLVDGSIRFLPPAGWESIGKPDDRLQAIFRARNGIDIIEMHVTPQTRDIPETQAASMAVIIGKGIRDGAKKAGRDFLLPPRVEKDDRFFLKMHDRLRGTDSDGREYVSDRIQLYRVLGLNLVHVVCTAKTDSPEEADAIHAQAEDMLYGMRLTRGAHAVVFGRAKLKVTPPIDWKVSKTDEPNGLVGTFTDPKEPLRQIIVRARVLPKEAQTDEGKRQAFLEKMIDAERRTPPLKPVSADAEQPSPLPPPAGLTYLRHLRTTAERGEQKLTVDTRYFTVADILVSVRSVAGDTDEGIDKLTDELCSSVKPARE